MSSSATTTVSTDVAFESIVSSIPGASMNTSTSPKSSLTTRDRESYANYPLKGIAQIHPHDVLCGRGGQSNSHPGNAQWRMLVAANKELYVTLPKKQKMLLSQSIVNAVRSQSPPGRFLQKDGNGNGLWYDVGDKRAQEKTSQALREGAPEIRTKLHSSSMIASSPNSTSASPSSVPLPSTLSPDASSSRVLDRPEKAADSIPHAVPTQSSETSSTSIFSTTSEKQPWETVLRDQQSSSSLNSSTTQPTKNNGTSQSRATLSTSLQKPTSSPNPTQHDSVLPISTSSPDSLLVPDCTSSAPKQPRKQYLDESATTHCTTEHTNQTVLTEQTDGVVAVNIPTLPTTQSDVTRTTTMQTETSALLEQQPQHRVTMAYSHDIHEKTNTTPQYQFGTGHDTIHSVQPMQVAQNGSLAPQQPHPNTLQFQINSPIPQSDVQQTRLNDNTGPVIEPPCPLNSGGEFSLGSMGALSDMEQARLMNGCSFGTVMSYAYTGNNDELNAVDFDPSYKISDGAPATSFIVQGNNAKRPESLDQDFGDPLPVDGGLDPVGFSIGSMMSIGSTCFDNTKLENAGLSFGSMMSCSVARGNSGIGASYSTGGRLGTNGYPSAVDGGLQDIGTSFGSLTLGNYSVDMTKSTESGKTEVPIDTTRYTITTPIDDVVAPPIFKLTKSKGSLLECSDTESDDDETPSTSQLAFQKSVEWERMQEALAVHTGRANIPQGSHANFAPPRKPSIPAQTTTHNEHLTYMNNPSPYFHMVQDQGNQHYNHSSTPPIAQLDNSITPASYQFPTTAFSRDFSEMSTLSAADEHDMYQPVSYTNPMYQDNNKDKNMFQQPDLPFYNPQRSPTLNCQTSQQHEMESMFDPIPYQYPIKPTYAENHKYAQPSSNMRGYTTARSEVPGGSNDLFFNRSSMTRPRQPSLNIMMPPPPSQRPMGIDGHSQQQGLYSYFDHQQHMHQQWQPWDGHMQQRELPKKFPNKDAPKSIFHH